MDILILSGIIGIPDGIVNDAAKFRPMTERRRVSTDSRWEGRFGYSRAVVVGDRCVVSGTTDPTHDHLDDAAAQARAALSVIEKALLQAGFSLVDVVWTRM